MQSTYKEKQIENLLRQLIGVNTCNPPGDEAKLVQLILKMIKGGAAESTVISHGGQRASLVVDIKGKDVSRTVGFAGHLDTVPAGDPLKWQMPPFAGVCKEGVLYGRGASDMRGGLTAMLLLIRQYSENGTVPEVNLRFLFTADEESGGTGVTALREQGFFDGLDFLFVCEPTGCLPGVAEKGAVWVDATVTGKSAHASIPEQGVNALEWGMAYLTDLKSWIEQAPEHPLLGKNSCSVTCAASGIKTNMIPDKAAFSADIRLVPHPDFQNNRVIEELFSRADAFNQRVHGLRITLGITNNRHVIESRTEGVYYENLQGVFEQLQLPFTHTGIHFYTDASLILPYIPVPFVILGPGEQEDCHAIDEKIELSSIAEAVEIYDRFIQSLGGK